MSHKVKSLPSILVFQKILTRYRLWNFWKRSAKSALGAAFLRWYMITLINVKSLSCEEYKFATSGCYKRCTSGVCGETSYALHFPKLSAGCFEIQWPTSVCGRVEKNFQKDQLAENTVWTRRIWQLGKGEQSDFDDGQRFQTNLKRWWLHVFFTMCCSQSDKTDKNFGVYVSEKLSWHSLFSARMKKVNSVFHSLKKNYSYKLQFTCKLGLYKSLLLPGLTYGFYCALLSRADMKSLEKSRKE